MPIEKYPSDIWFPLTKNWDWQLKEWKAVSLVAGEQQVFLEDKDLISPKGWLYGVILSADSPNVGVIFEYTGPKGRLIRITYTIQGLYDLGIVNLASPSIWTVTRWAQSTVPEYAVNVFPGWFTPFQPKFTMKLINAGLTSITVHKFLITLLCLFEE